MLKLQILLLALMAALSLDVHAAEDGLASSGQRGVITSQPCGQFVPAVRTGEGHPKGSRTAIVLDPKNRDLFKPMTRKEVALLIEVLGSTGKNSGKGGEGSDKPSLRKDLSLDRIFVLTQDIVAHLAMIHMDQTMAQIKKMPKPDGRALEWGAEMTMLLDRCGRGRYEGFGGEPTYRDTLDIVRDNRVILESLVLDKWILQGKMPGITIPGAGRPGGGEPGGTQ